MTQRPSALTVLFFSLTLCLGVVLLLNALFSYYDYSSALRLARSKNPEAELKIREHKINDIALRKVRFTLNMPEAKEVYVVANFSLWEAHKIKLEKGENGVFSDLIVLPQGEYKYYFEVDGRPVADPSNTDSEEYNGKTVSLRTVI